MTTLRAQALHCLLLTDAAEKAATVLAIDATALPIGPDETLPEPHGIPGRPAQPALVPHTELKTRKITTVAGRIALLHALAHIEFNAINLALDLCWRFAGLPERFYREWWQVAREEAQHFQLLRDHLRSLDADYGDLPAHNALWEMAEKTRGDLLARIALVPRTLEARGLDASPPIKAKLLSVGDEAGAAILDVILRDEIGHVAVGNHWYRQFCEDRQLDPIGTYRALAEQYGAPRPRAPFNLPARRLAGFDEAELQALSDDA